MTIQEIKELIEVAKESGVAELEVQRGENRVRIRLSIGGPQTQEIVFNSGGHSIPTTHIAQPAPQAVAPAAVPPPLAPEAEVHGRERQRAQRLEQQRGDVVERHCARRP